MNITIFRGEQPRQWGLPVVGLDELAQNEHESVAIQHARASDLLAYADILQEHDVYLFMRHTRYRNSSPVPLAQQKDVRNAYAMQELGIIGLDYHPDAHVFCNHTWNEMTTFDAEELAPYKGDFSEFAAHVRTPQQGLYNQATRKSTTNL